MPDPIGILEAVAAAAVLAAVVVLLGGWPWRKPHPARAYFGSVLGVGLGFFAGCWLLGVEPHWPPREDLDRILFLLFPALLCIELAAAFLRRFRWLAWLPRLILAAAAARVVLHNSIYLTDLAGPDSRKWTPAQTWLILAALAAALAATWAALALLVRPASPPTTQPPAGGGERGKGRVVLLAVAFACAGAAVTVTLSGYASVGQVALSLAGALAGALAASLALAGPPDLRGVLGVGVVGLFAVLVAALFFDDLTTTNAALLFFAPLLCWLPELPYVRRLRPWVRGVAAVVLVAVPVGLAVVQAYQSFVEGSKASSSTPNGASSQDYLDFGK
jgi:hypothetical protein